MGACDLCPLPVAPGTAFAQLAGCVLPLSHSSPGTPLGGEPGPPGAAGWELDLGSQNLGRRRQGQGCPSENSRCRGLVCDLVLPTQDVPEQRSMEYPKLYEPGQLNLLFNKREFFICIAQGIYTSVLMFFIPYGVFAEATRDDGTQLADYQSFAVTVATSLVIVVSVQVGGRWGTCSRLWKE